MGGSRARTTRRALAGLAAAALAVSLASGASHSSPSPAQDAAPQNATSQPVRWTGGLAGQAPCPEGTSRNQTLLTESFENGIPNNDFNDGWSAVADHGAAGYYAARSTVNSSDSEDWFFTDWAQASVGAQTMLAFTSRGTVPTSNYARADVNSVTNLVRADNRNWTGKVYDITAATEDEQGRLGPWFQHRARLDATAWWEVDNVQIYTCRNAAVDRLQGADRYATSAAVAGEFPSGGEVVYLASGTSFADALAGSALAAKHQAPVLLVTQGSIPASVRAELDRLNPQSIVIYGGTSAVSNTVAEQAEQFTDGSVTRIAGDDRYQTSAKIIDTYPRGVNAIYIASGEDYPDALSGSAAAGRNHWPMGLTGRNTLPTATRDALTRLQPGRIVILGGTSAVSASVEQALDNYTDGGVTRIAGDNRYETSAQLARSFPNSPDRVFVATGTAFPDALSASALAGTERAPVVLTQPTNLPRDVQQAVNSLGADSGLILGGYTSVHSIVLDQLGRVVG